MAANPKKKKATSAKVRAWPDGTLACVPGFRTAALYAGIKKKKGRPDLGVLYAEEPAVTAGVYTTNLLCAAPVTLSRQALKKSRGWARAVVVNAGNANACTGKRGERDARRMLQLVAKGLGCPESHVQVCSTGVIGHALPMKIVASGIKQLTGQIQTHEATGDFAEAILTTDLVKKTAAVCVDIGGRTVRIAGVTKGSGMIAPNMATTLGFVATDACIEPAALQAALSRATDLSYNCLTVDGDTSTNDTLLAMASGRAGHAPIRKPAGAAYAAFLAGLQEVCNRLAYLIARDGEGATHTVTVVVEGTADEYGAQRIAKAISESPLVKTAVAGNDPNWGRIMAAAGRAGVRFNPDASSLKVCGVEIFRNGTPTRYKPDKVAAAMKKGEVLVQLRVGKGKGRARYFTCDLTHGYITINADYHT